MAADRAPHAPWVLTGEWMATAVARSRNARALLPAELGQMPGPVVLVGASYDDSPVGPFVELAVAVPARVGLLRPGYAVVAAAVSVAPARLGYRVNWGLPAEFGKLSWEADADTRRIEWEERGLSITLRCRGLSFPAFVPVRAVQRRADGPVVVPRRVRARGRLGRATVDVPTEDYLAELAGSHRGALLSSARFVVRPARRPAGIMSSLRAPLTVPEPATASDVRPSAPHSRTWQGLRGRYSELSTPGRIAQLVRAQPSHG